MEANNDDNIGCFEGILTGDTEKHILDRVLQRASFSKFLFQWLDPFVFFKF